MTVGWIVRSLAISAGLVMGWPALCKESRPDVRMWRLDCGQLQVNDASSFSDVGALDGRAMRLSDGCYLVRHDHDLLLWDAGVPTTLLHARPTTEAVSPTLSVDLPSQLSVLGFRPDDIKWLALSHYHWDHVGQASAFPGATLLIGDADWKALHGRDAPFGADPKLLEHWISGGGHVDAVQGDRDVFGDGSVLILAVPGHTPGSQALLVRLPRSGPVILSGDAMLMRRWTARFGVPAWNASRADSLASTDRLHALARNLGARIIVQHDPADVAGLSRFPDPTR